MLWDYFLQTLFLERFEIKWKMSFSVVSCRGISIGFLSFLVQMINGNSSWSDTWSLQQHQLIDVEIFPEISMTTTTTKREEAIDIFNDETRDVTVCLEQSPDHKTWLRAPRQQLRKWASEVPSKIYEIPGLVPKLWNMEHGTLGSFRTRGLPRNITKLFRGSRKGRSDISSWKI